MRRRVRRPLYDPPESFPIGIIIHARGELIGGHQAAQQRSGLPVLVLRLGTIHLRLATSAAPLLSRKTSMQRRLCCAVGWEFSSKTEGLLRW